MDDLLIRVLSRLVRIHDEFGEASFEDAAHRALVSIGAAAMQEAGRRAALDVTAMSDARVVAFPLDRARLPDGNEPDWERTDE